MNPQRRARLVCYRCHSKKIKCDLAQQIQSRSCRHCTQAKSVCQLRPSKRGLGKQRVARDVALDPPVEDVAAQLSPPSWSPGAGHAVVASQIPSPDSIQSDRGNQHLDENEDSPPFNQASCYGDTGYMQLLSRDAGIHVPTPAASIQQAIPVPVSDSNFTISAALQASFLESYFAHCHTWCPVLDPDVLLPHLDQSPLLQHALALCGNRVNPPLIHMQDSADYYAVAKAHFHSGSEKNVFVRLASIMLFWWWSTGSATMLSMDNAWWWTGIAIRIAQEMGLHREPPLSLPRSTAGLRRRIWWTLFIRDRILAVSQGRPLNIDQDFCTVAMVSAADFPGNPSTHTGIGIPIFIARAQLATITGHITKQRPDTSAALITWIQSLPAAITLKIRTPRTQSFHRDIHRLHLSYLAAIVLLNLAQPADPSPLPRASEVAIIAASCIARLWEDYLARGNIRFLSGDAGWEIAVALLALLDARRAGELCAAANADIKTLRTALRGMARLWPSSKMFEGAFDRLLGDDDDDDDNPAKHVGREQHPVDAALVVRTDSRAENNNHDDGNASNDKNNNHNTAADTDTPHSPPFVTTTTTDWMEYFPFITGATSALIDAVLARNLSSLAVFTDPLWPVDINDALQAFLALPGGDYWGEGVEGDVGSAGL
ncbi:fungal-specific transcription factor domain-containing protein [Aspergillus pseudoustus]|uniref:Fungal-specific transcription factor domain-containing protein n=1 Tax=Aspergillus pseudoustus TaxID=1810923 RepID=A0ABR4IHN7_9EURO